MVRMLRTEVSSEWRASRTLCDGELSLLMHVPDWNKMEIYISWVWIKPLPLSDLTFNGLMGINTLFDLRAFFQRTKAPRFTSSPHTHTQKDRWGLPSSSMLLSTWGFTQNGGGRLEKTSHHLTLASTFKCTCSCSFRS